MDRVLSLVLNNFNRLKDRVVRRSVLLDSIQDVVHSDPLPVLVSLRRKGWLLHLFKGYYYVVSPDEFHGGYLRYSALELVAVVFNKLKIPWYIGLYSALERHGIAWQKHTSLIILNTDISGSRLINGVSVLFRRLDPDLFFSVLSFESRNRILCKVSSPEKTVADFAYFNLPLSKKLLDAVDGSTLRDVLRVYPLAAKKRVFS